MAGTAASLGISVFPVAKDFGPLLSKQVIPSATDVGAKTGRSFSDAFSAEASKAGIGADTAIADSAKAAQLAIESASVKVVAARAREEDAAGRVRVAEAALAEAREKYAANSAQVVAAEERLDTARRNVVVRSDTAGLAEARLTAVRESAAAAADKSAAATNTESVSLTRLKTLATESNGTFAALSSQFAKLGALVVAAVAIDMGVKGVQAAAAFQQSQERLVTTAGELQRNLAMVSQGILTMAGQVGYSAQDLSVGMYTVESAGYHASDALTVLKASAQGAKEENADLSTVTNAVTSAMRDYHLPASDAAVVTSKLIAAVSDGKTTFQDLTGAMSAVLPVASATHISMSDVLGDLSSMTLHGESAEQSAQNLAFAIRGLANPALTTTKELAMFGINSADLSKNLGKTGVAGAMNEVVTAILQHMGPAGTTLLNAFNQSKQAANDANTMLRALPPSLQDLAQKMQDGKISMHDWTQGLKEIGPLQANLLTQWLTQEKRATGFNDALKVGGNASQTFTQALTKATGGSASLNVALMLTGENAAKTQQNIADVSKATSEAGGNTLGWSAIQQTLNQRLAEIRAGIGAWVIQLGQILVPIITNVVNGLMSMGSWLVKNRVWIGLVATVIGALVGPIVAVRLAVLAWETVQKVILSIRLAMIALNTAMLANPAIAITAAVLALAAAVVYCYFHFRVFRQILDDIGNFLKSVFLAVVHAVGDAIDWVTAHWRIFAAALGIILAPLTLIIAPIVLIATHLRQIGDAAVWMWDHAAKPAVDGIVTGVRGLAAIVMWGWSTILKPVLTVLGNTFLIIAKIILAIVIAPIVLAIRGLTALFDWAWPRIVAAWTLIGNAARAVYSVTLAPIVNAIEGGWRDLVSVAEWLYQQVGVRIFNAIGDAVQLVYTSVLLPIWRGLQNDWKMLQVGAQILYENVFRPIWIGIGLAVQLVYVNVLQPIWRGLQNDWRILQDAARFLCNNVLQPIWSGIGSLISTVYHDTIEPIWGLFKKGLSDLQTAFQLSVKVIGQIWTGLEKAFGTPIEFVIKTVLNGGIIKAINWILKAVGQSIPTIPDPGLPTFATGGVVPGSGPVDSVHAMLTPGEGVLIPAATAALGGAAGIRAINELFGGGGGPSVTAAGWPGYGLGGFVSDLLNGIGNAASSAWSTVKGAALGGLRAAASGFFDNVVKPLISAIPGGQGDIVKQYLTGIINTVENDVLTFLGAKDQAAAATRGALGGSIPTGSRLAILTQALSADGIPQAQWPVWESGLNTLITRESNWNPGAVNNWDVNAKNGTPSTGLAQTIKPTFERFRNPSLPDSMINPVANVAAAIRYIIADYGSISHVQQANANLPPKGYDGGGFLEPGFSLAYNGTRRPEPVLSGDQWDAIARRPLGTDGGSTHHYHITSHDPVSVAHEIERRETARLRARL